MARKLNTFVTSVGFFDLAVAAPSMKAALDAWGFKHNAFHQGFASETGDAKIIAAAMANPGIVLRRPVGTNEAFRADAELPRDFKIPGIGNLPPSDPKATQQAGPKKTSSKAKDQGAGRAAVISFEKEKAKRDRERAKEEGLLEKRHAKREMAVQRAESILAEARQQHERKLARFEREQAALDRRIKAENDKWERRLKSSEAKLDREPKE